LVTAAIRDVTERKKADQEIRDLNASLEQRVSERTGELLASNEALRKSNEDLNQFRVCGQPRFAGAIETGGAL